jgi:multiple antibiotic resistance protein
MQSLAEYTLLAFSSLFVIVDPIAVVPAFLAMTPRDSPEQRVRMAKVACLVTAGVLLVFALTGGLIFKFLGITMPAFQIAGSIILLLIALDMLRARRSPVQETEEETDAGAVKDDIAITPLAVPMLAGPGAISNVILLHEKANGLAQELVLIASILGVSLLSYLVFHFSAHRATWLSPIFLRLTTRLMGLLLAAIAMQFLVNALRSLGVIH